MEKKIAEKLERADAHPYGARPFVRKNYIEKFQMLTKNIITEKESKRFLSTVQRLKIIKKGQLKNLNIEIDRNKLKKNNKEGIF